MTPLDLAKRLKEMAGHVAEYLAEQQTPQGAFPAPDGYGKMFAALLWAWEPRFAEPRRRALAAVAGELRTAKPSDYHFEFNRFAALKLLEVCPELGDADRLVGPERYTGTRVANWTLLRAYCRLHSRRASSRLLGRLEVLWVRSRFSDPSGVIEDQRGAYTMQYHAFCVALLGELLAGPLKTSALVSAWFERSVNALAGLVLPGGECNYIGRGSLQSFGYAAAILALAHAYRLTGNTWHLDTAGRVIGHLAARQRPDGSFPLVLSATDEGDPARFDLQDPAYAGWWSYNKFYDYLPFTGAMLRLAAAVLEVPVTRRPFHRASQPGTLTRLGRTLLIGRTPRYTAVVALPNRVWASSQPMPFVAWDATYPLPNYGGEQTIPSLYSRHALPLPVVELEGGGEVLLADGRYHWCGPSDFEGTVGGICHVRAFDFLPDEIRVCDRLWWPARVRVRAVRAPRVLLARRTVRVEVDRLRADCVAIRFDAPISEESGALFGPQGPLRAFFCLKPIRVEDGGEFACEARISLSPPAGAA
jgi:hypothetical protein